MTHKQNCIDTAMQYLESRNLSHVFDYKIFNHYYTKNHGAQGNAFLVGLNAADMMIRDYVPTYQPDEN